MLGFESELKGAKKNPLLSAWGLHSNSAGRQWCMYDCTWDHSCVFLSATSQGKTPELIRLVQPAAVSRCQGMSRLSDLVYSWVSCVSFSPSPPCARVELTHLKPQSSHLFSVDCGRGFDQRRCCIILFRWYMWFWDLFCNYFSYLFFSVTIFQIASQVQAFQWRIYASNCSEHVVIQQPNERIPKLLCIVIEKLKIPELSALKFLNSEEHVVDLFSQLSFFLSFSLLFSFLVPWK